MRQELQDLFDTVALVTRQELLEKKAVVQKVVYFYPDADGQTKGVLSEIFIDSPESVAHEAKRVALRKIGNLLAKKFPPFVLVVFVSEAWMVVADPKSIDMTLPPSRNPSRQECLILAACSAEEGFEATRIIPFGRTPQDALYIIEDDVREFQDQNPDGFTAKHDLFEYFLEGYREKG